MLLYLMLVCTVNPIRGFEYYGGTAGPTSKYFKVSLINNGNAFNAHVYGMKSPSTKSPNNEWTNNWIEFEHNDNDQTIVKITRISGKNNNTWPNNTHI